MKGFKPILICYALKLFIIKSQFIFQVVDDDSVLLEIEDICELILLFNSLFFLLLCFTHLPKTLKLTFLEDSPETDYENAKQEPCDKVHDSLFTLYIPPYCLHFISIEHDGVEEHILHSGGKDETKHIDA